MPDKISGLNPGHVGRAEWPWTCISRYNEHRKRSNASISRSDESLHIYATRTYIYARRKPNTKHRSHTYHTRSGCGTRSGAVSIRHICVVSGASENWMDSVVRYFPVDLLMLMPRKTWTAMRYLQLPKMLSWKRRRGRRRKRRQ